TGTDVPLCHRGRDGPKSGPVWRPGLPPTTKGPIMTTMGETSSRGKSIAIAIALLVVVLAAAGFLATQWGVSRALTVLVAIVLVGALAWGILIVVGILSAASARREPDDSDTTLRN